MFVITMTAEVLTITPEERKEIETAASPLITAARACKVETNQQYSLAGDQLKAIKAAQKLLEAKKKKLLDPLKAAVKAVKDLFEGPELELDQAEGLYKRAMITYADEQERIRREEQARLDRLAREEQQRKDEQARKTAAEAEAARQAGNDKKAEKLEAKAEKLADVAASIVAPQVQRAAPKASGIAQAEYWSAVVVDFEQLVLAVAAALIRETYRAQPSMSPQQILDELYQLPAVPISALQPNQALLNQMARSLKKELRYPGVRAVRETGLRAGSK
jgi:hypothetical protein